MKAKSPNEHHHASVAPHRVLGIFVLATLNMAIITSLRNLPLVAQYATASIAYYLIVAIVFIIPTALVAAELATGWPKAGGVYIWVREAFGDRWGFVAVWLQWVHNIPWYPAMLAFVAATLAYGMGAHHLVTNKTYILTVILVGFWSITLFNFLGLKTSGWFSSLAVIIGSILPGFLIIVLGFIWFGSGQTNYLSFQPIDFIPDLSDFRNIVFLTGMLLAFAGLEVTAVHAKEVKNPKKNFPKAIFLSAFFTLILFILGSLAIALVLPQKNISLVAGVMEAFAEIFSIYNLNWLTSVVAFLIVIGAIGELNAWIAGPSKGLFVTARHGNLPPIFQRINKEGVPVNLMIFQALIVSITAIIIIYLPTLSISYWILIALSAQIYLIMYFMMFISAIRLRYTKPKVYRKYRVSEGNLGMWFIAGVGALTSLFGTILGFFPPAQLDIQNVFAYELSLFISIIILFIIPFIIHAFRKPHWMPTIHHNTLHADTE